MAAASAMVSSRGAGRSSGAPSRWGRARVQKRVASGKVDSSGVLIGVHPTSATLVRRLTLRRGGTDATDRSGLAGQRFVPVEVCCSTLTSYDGPVPLSGRRWSRRFLSRSVWRELALTNAKRSELALARTAAVSLLRRDVRRSGTKARSRGDGHTTDRPTGGAGWTPLTPVWCGVMPNRCTARRSRSRLGGVATGTVVVPRRRSAIRCLAVRSHPDAGSFLPVVGCGRVRLVRADTTHGVVVCQAPGHSLDGSVLAVSPVLRPMLSCLCDRIGRPAPMLASLRLPQ